MLYANRNWQYIIIAFFWPRVKNRDDYLNSPRIRKAFVNIMPTSVVIISLSFARLRRPSCNGGSSEVFTFWFQVFSMPLKYTIRRARFKMCSTGLSMHPSEIT